MLLGAEESLVVAASLQLFSGAFEGAVAETIGGIGGLACAASRAPGNTTSILNHEVPADYLSA